MLKNIENKYLKNLLIFLLIFSLVSLARFIPHPPNFTILVALTFYISLYFGYKSSLYLLISFIITDVVLGLHNLIYFTWTTLLFISLNSQKFSETYMTRFCGVIFSVLLFYFITNFGVYLFADHGADKNVIEVYLLGIPFLINNMLCSLIFAIIIEIVIFLQNKNPVFNLKNK